MQRTDTDEFDPYDDREIIRGVLGGRIDDFAILLARYRRYVGKIVAGIVPAEMIPDLAQEIFVEAYTSLAAFDPRSSFKKWLAGIAVHRCYDYWRQHYRCREVPLSALGEEHLQWVEGALAVRARARFAAGEERKEAAEILQWAMAGLTAEDRMVLTLVHLEGFSVQETAAALGWSQVNVRVRAHRSRQKLRKRLTGLLEEER